ncbi:MAG: AraC family transcriptional regulator [Terrimicrobiaceae bacterium]
MTPQKSDSFAYISTTPERSRWGVEILGCGFARTPPHHPYPAPGHPPDHDFDFESGRTLQALQILFILEGSGWIEMETKRRQRIPAGSVIFLLPGIWHRYRPDPKTGWTEYWVELDGFVVRRLIEERVLNDKTCIFQNVGNTGIAELLENLHAFVTGRHPYTVPELANTAHKLLGVCSELQGAGKSPTRAAVIVRRAEEHLNGHHSEPIDLEALARKLGMGYSRFRRIFREQTGISPWQYLLRSRLAHARRLLASGEETVASIAETVGFGSGFHFSAAFKKAYGVSPGLWRKKHKGSPAASTLKPFPERKDS